MARTATGYATREFSRGRSWPGQPDVCKTIFSSCPQRTARSFPSLPLGPRASFSLKNIVPVGPGRRERDVLSQEDLLLPVHHCSPVARGSSVLCALSKKALTPTKRQLVDKRLFGTRETKKRRPRTGAVQG